MRTCSSSTSFILVSATGLICSSRPSKHLKSSLPGGVAQPAATQAWGPHLQLEHALLDGVRGDVAEDRHRARLPQAVDAVLRLVLRCRPAA